MWSYNINQTLSSFLNNQPCNIPLSRLGSNMCAYSKIQCLSSGQLKLANSIYYSLLSYHKSYLLFQKIFISRWHFWSETKSLTALKNRVKRWQIQAIAPNEMILVRIVKDWDWPDLKRQTPNQQGSWEGVQFTTDPVEECDFLIMLNNRMKTDVQVKCPKENIWALMQEPYVRGFNDWMVEGHEYFSRVYTHHLPTNDPKYIVSHPAIPWHVNKTFDQLVPSNIPPKSKAISWIVGNATDLPGHIKRLSFLKFIQKDGSLDIDLFGRAVRYIEDKWGGLAPYRYSLAIENSSSPDYWTEKLADCFLSWTVPVYYGCTNLEKYFPKESFIRINIDQPEITLTSIKSLIREDDWGERLPALEEARRLVLYKYQLFPHLATLIQSRSIQRTSKSFVTIPAYKKSKKTLLYRAAYKVKNKVMKLFFR